MLYAFAGASACIQLKKFNEVVAWCDDGLAVSFTRINNWKQISSALQMYYVKAQVWPGVCLNTSVVCLACRLTCTVPKRLSDWLVSENNTASIKWQKMSYMRVYRVNWVYPLNPSHGTDCFWVYVCSECSPAVWRVFTWRHGGHVGVPNQSCGSWKKNKTFFCSNKLS